jgi:hypothetical protein
MAAAADTGLLAGDKRPVTLTATAFNALIVGLPYKGG